MQEIKPPTTTQEPFVSAQGAGAGPVGNRDWRKRYGMALGAVAIAFFLRGVVLADLDNRLAFAFFLPAAMMAAWYGGLGPGLVAAAIGLLIADFFFLPPHHALGPLGPAERTAITVYALTSTLAVFLMDNLHGRIRDLEAELADLRRAGPDAR